MKNETVRERFLDDVKDHMITIIKDDPPYRHIRLSIPDSGTYRFDLISWPGHLCYTGDMGTYTFSRINDMFDFFRGPLTGDLQINPGYWSEKVLATSVFGGGVTAFNFDLFEEKVLEELNEFVTDWHPGLALADREEYEDELRQEVQWEILDLVEERSSLDYAHGVLADYNSDFGFELNDTHEWRFETFTHHFLWCCFALAWGIRKYDIAKGALSNECGA